MKLVMTFRSIAASETQDMTQDMTQDSQKPSIKAPIGKYETRTLLKTCSTT